MSPDEHPAPLSLGEHKALLSLGDLSGDGWRRLLTAARRRLEATGGALDGSVGVREPTDSERRVIIGITGVHRSASAGTLRVPLVALDAYLRDAYGHDVCAVVSYVDGVPIRDRPADRRREGLARDAATSIAQTSRHAAALWYQAWLHDVVADGTLTRILRRGSTDLSAALAVLDRLPADGTPLPVLAEQATGDTKALSGTPLSTLVLRALTIWFDLPAETAEEERSLWDAAGVIVDDLASQVLVLNIVATGAVVAEWLTAAARQGIPFRLTLHQLRAFPPVPVGRIIYVCENPAVLRAAAASHGADCAPLICTEGVGSVACRRLISTAAERGAEIRWRNDFDWPGLRMTSAAVSRFSAQPWRMSADDYLASASTGGSRLKGPATSSPWDPALARAMSDRGHAVMEERLLPQLLSDLAPPT